MIHTGDTVSIADDGKIFSDYDGFFDVYRTDNCSGPYGYCWDVQRRYVSGRVPEGDDLHSTYKVVYIGRHLERPDAGMLAIITNELIGKTFLIQLDGLELFNSMPHMFNVGDEVCVVDDGKVYSTYSILIKGLSGQVNEKLLALWRDGGCPNVGDKFKVIWYGQHTARYTNKALYIISDEVNTYIIEERGLEKARAKNVPSEWQLYIHYVREWSWEHRGTPVTGIGAGPYDFNAWLTRHRNHQI